MNANGSWDWWSIVSQAFGFSIVSSALTVCGALFWKRWKRGDEATIAAGHDHFELQRALAGVTNEQIRQVFEVQNKIITDSVQRHEECEKRVQALEERGESRRIRIENAEARIDQLEGLLRDAGLPVPPITH